MIGHNLEYTQSTSLQDDVNFLSYSSSIVSDLGYAGNGITPTSVDKSTSDLLSVTDLTSGDVQIQIQGSVGSALFDGFSSMTANTATVVGSYIEAIDLNGDPVYVPVISHQVVGNTVTVVLSGSNGTIDSTCFGTSFNYINETDFGFVTDEVPLNDPNNSNIIGSYGSSLYSQFSNGTYR